MSSRGGEASCELLYSVYVFHRLPFTYKQCEDSGHAALQPDRDALEEVMQRQREDEDE